MFLYHIHITGSDDDSALLVKARETKESVGHFLTYYELEPDEIDGKLMIYRCNPDALPFGPIGWSEKDGMEFVGEQSATGWLKGAD